MWIHIGNIVVNIILIILYIVFFGHESIQKYLDDRVITIKREERTSKIPPPSMCHHINIEINCLDNH